MGNSFLNVGVIGLGEQGWNNLLPSLAVLKDVNIQAVCDVDAERLHTAARNYGAKPYDDYTKLLDDEDLDAVVVASHPNVHANVLRETIVRKIPTFIEKPPTLTTQELEELIKLNENNQTITAVGLNFSFTEPVKFIKDLMKKPEFGKLQYLRVCHYGNKPDTTLWGLDSRARSFLLSQAIHPLGLIYDLGREHPNAKRVIHAHGSDAGFLFSISSELQDDAGDVFVAELLTTSTSPFFEWQLQLVSNTGVMVQVNSLWEVEVYSKERANKMIDNPKWWRDTWRPSPLSGGFKRNGYEHQFAEFVDNIRKQKVNGTCIEKMMPIYNVMDAMEAACA